MASEADIPHLERRIQKLEQHIAEQDGEIFRQARMLDAAVKRLQKLAKQLDTAAPESPIDTEASASDQIPPHY